MVQTATFSTFPSSSSASVTDSSRKRKQELQYSLDYAMPSVSPTRSSQQQQAAPWSEFVYSTPNSPSNSPQITQHPHQQSLAWLDHGNNHNNGYTHFDPMVMSSYPIKPETLNDHQRRHSIAVGDFAYHSDLKQENPMNLHHLPTPPSQQYQQQQRTSSQNEKSNLHLDMSSKQQPSQFANFSSTASMPSPSTPAFFTSAFLESLSDDYHAGDTATTTTSNDFSFSMAPTSNTIQFMNPNDMLAHASPEHMLNDIMAENEDFVFDSSHHTVAPSALSSDNPFYQQSTSPFSDLIMPHDQPISQSLHRGSTSRSSTSSLASTLQQQHIGSIANENFVMDFGNSNTSRKVTRLQQMSPPASPTHSSSVSNTSSSPSPPITPMLQQQQQQQQQAYQQGFNDGPTFQHPTIPEEDDEDMVLNQAAAAADFVGYLQPGGLDDPLKAAKGGIVSTRMLQSANVAQLRPLIRHYLQSPNPAASGERTVVILTSKVAQKSYGTEKR
jgi:hypothetical protein